MSIPEITDPFLKDYFGVIEQCAIKNERCPGDPAIKKHLLSKNNYGRLPIQPSPGPHLARMGYLKIEIFAMNYRVITICTGPHTGKATLASPHGNGVVAKTIETDQRLLDQNSPAGLHRELAGMDRAYEGMKVDLRLFISEMRKNRQKATDLRTQLAAIGGTDDD